MKTYSFKQFDAGELYQTYRKELPHDKCEHYEHNQTRNIWMKLIPETTFR